MNEGKKGKESEEVKKKSDSESQQMSGFNIKMPTLWLSLRFSFQKIYKKM